MRGRVLAQTIVSYILNGYEFPLIGKMTVLRYSPTVRTIKSVLMVMRVISSGVYLVFVLLGISKVIARVSFVFSSWSGAEGEVVETTIGKRRCLGGNTIEKTEETVAPKKNMDITF